MHYLKRLIVENHPASLPQKVKRDEKKEGKKEKKGSEKQTCR